MKAVVWQRKPDALLQCDRLITQRETNQVPDQDKGNALSGYPKLYGQVPGRQAEYLPDRVMPLLSGDHVLRVDGFATHRVPLSKAPQAYSDFQSKKSGTVNMVLKP